MIHFHRVPNRRTLKMWSFQLTDIIVYKITIDTYVQLSECILFVRILYTITLTIKCLSTSLKKKKFKKGKNNSLRYILMDFIEQYFKNM